MDTFYQFLILASLLAVTIVAFSAFLWKLNNLHDLLNSRLSSLIELTAKSSFAAGKEQQRQEQLEKEEEEK